MIGKEIVSEMMLFNNLSNSFNFTDCYETLWTLTFFFLSIFLDFIFLFLFSDDEEAHDIAVT